MMRALTGEIGRPRRASGHAAAVGVLKQRTDRTRRTALKRPFPARVDPPGPPAIFRPLRDIRPSKALSRMPLWRNW